MNNKNKTRFYRRKWFIGLVAIFLIGGILGALQDENKEEPKEEVEKVEEQQDHLKDDEDEKDEEQLKEDKELDLDLSIPEREFTVGKSDKNFLDITDSEPTSVRNDVTERWKMVKFAESVDVTEYLISYTDLYWEEDDLVHVLINFNYNTTTVINNFGSYLSVRVHEYVKKEEHDAKKIGSGLELAEYNVYTDNGDIVDFYKLVEAEENED